MYKSVFGFSDWNASAFIKLYTANLTWNLFLTSTAIHAIFLITSPVQAVYKWYCRKNSDSDTVIPYVSSFLGSILWFWYALFIQDLKLVLLQSYAVFMQVIFLLAMTFYRTRRNRLLRILIIEFLTVFLLFYFISKLPYNVGKQVTGICASGFQIVGSFVCPYLIYKAVTLKRIDFVPFAPVAFTWVMEIHAIIYSIGINDFYLLIANVVFFCMDGCLLVMFFIYPTDSLTIKNAAEAKFI